MNPKGASKPAEATDPLLLNGVAVPGEVRQLARCMVEEFAQIGYRRDDLFALFQRTDYLMMNMILRSEGETYVRDLIDEVVAEVPVFTITSSVSELDEDDCSHESELGGY